MITTGTLSRGAYDAGSGSLSVREGIAVRRRFVERVAVSLCCLCVVGPAVRLDGRPERPGSARAASLGKVIDRKLRRPLARVEATTDAVFLRRVYLDLVGTIPSVEQTRAFLTSTEKDKRKRVVDRLLDSNAWTEQWASVWCEILLGDYRRMPATVGDKRLAGRFAKESFEAFRDWLRDQFAVDTPWAKVVSTVVQATGELSKTPPLYYKATFVRGQPDVLTLADGMSRSFLGVRIACARCHDHPFDRWTRDDYFGLAAFFTHLDAQAQGGDEATEVSLREIGEAVAKLPQRRKPPPTFFFGGRGRADRPRLPQLASFLQQQQEQLGRNLVNRTWAVLFGSGFVEPLDDFNLQNKPREGALLDRLTKDFLRNGASLRFLLRSICYSRVYGRELGGGNADGVDGEWLEGKAVRQLTAEQLFRSLMTASSGPGKSVDFSSRQVIRRHNQFFNELRQVFPTGQEWTEVTRLPGNTAQLLFLQNSRTMNKILQRSGLVYHFRKGRAKPSTVVEEAFLAILNRLPTTAETARYVEHLEGSPDRGGCEDLIWALFNSAEFTTLH
jgi:hypothetical protein